MKLLIVFAALFAVALAAPVEHAEHAEHVEILKLESVVEPESYSYSAETSDGTSRQEEGQVKDVGSEHPTLVVHGSFSWKDHTDGKVYSVSYTADEYGFQPVGDHIPALPQIVH